MSETTIVKTFIGKYIDLSKVVSISNAKFIDRMGFGGWYVSFEIHIQLLDSPIVYTRKFAYDEYKFGTSREFKKVYAKDGVTLLAVERLQAQIDDLVAQWKKVNCIKSTF